MVLNVPLTPEIESKLTSKAAEAGVDVQTFVALALQRAALRPSMDELLGPLRAEFEGSGMSEQELVSLLETAKHEMRAQRRVQ